jgi:hypothetical protein
VHRGAIATAIVLHAELPGAGADASARTQSRSISGAGFTDIGTRNAGRVAPKATGTCAILANGAIQAQGGPGGAGGPPSWHCCEPSCRRTGARPRFGWSRPEEIAALVDLGLWDDRLG